MFWGASQVSPDLRLCLWLAIQGRFQELLAVLAPVCSSFSAVNVATSQCSELCPWGNCCLVGVRRGNKLASSRVQFGHVAWKEERSLPEVSERYFWRGLPKRYYFTLRTALIGSGAFY